MKEQMGSPLEGIRVADFTWVWAGPFCTMQLAHLGAEVIKVETRKRIDTTRMLPPWLGGKPNPDASGYFNQYSQGKLGVTLNLQDERARELARRLVAVSDIVAENYSPRVMQNWGLDYKSLRAVKPDIIMISLSAYGQTGPERDYVSYGPAQVPLSGLASLTGYEGGPPHGAGISYGDPTAGMHGAFAVLAALIHHQATGEGQYIDLSQWETSVATLPEGLMDYAINGAQPSRAGNRDASWAPSNVYRCLDDPDPRPAAGPDRWIAITVATEEEWDGFQAAVTESGADSTPFEAAAYRSNALRKAGETILDALISGWTRERSDAELTEVLQRHGVAAHPVASVKDIDDNPQLAAREFWAELDHPVVGVQRHPGVPYKFTHGDVTIRRPAPILGQHNDYVFGELLGLESAEYDELKASGVIA